MEEKPPQNRTWIVARDKAALLTRMMRLLAGDAQISFEGNLSKCLFPSSLERIAEGFSTLRRNTSYPVLDFAILKLDELTIRPILDTVLPENRFMEDIIHIQIERNGVLEFGCYDQFHKECIVCFSGVSPAFLDELKERRIIRSWCFAV